MTETMATVTSHSPRGLSQPRGQQAQLVLFPELALTGYPPEDLLLKEHFLRDARGALDRLAEETEGIVALVGFPSAATTSTTRWRCSPTAR